MAKDVACDVFKLALLPLLALALLALLALALPLLPLLLALVRTGMCTTDTGSTTT
jgi:hypothetical protein